MIRAPRSGPLAALVWWKTELIRDRVWKTRTHPTQNPGSRDRRRARPRQLQLATGV